MEKITVMKVVIVVVTVSKVNPDVCSTLFVDNAAPSGLISRECLVGGVEPEVERRF